MLWRGLGRVDSNGTWVPPVSYLEAQYIPTRKLHVFMALDSMVVKLAKQSKPAKQPKGRK